MKSFPFDSDLTFDSEGNPSYDRAADSEQLRGYFHLLFTDGVFMGGDSNAMLVTKSEQDMSVVVMPGNCNIQGALGIENASRTMVFEASGTTYDRIDTVVARLNTNHDYRKIDLYVVKGTEATTPVAPELTRTGGIYELRLADVFIAKNTTSISAERITDTRLTDDCGVVTANPQSIDTQNIYNQYQASLDKYMQYVRDCIDETTAGNLQTQITQLNSDLSDLTDVVAQQNSNIETLTSIMDEVTLSFNESYISNISCTAFKLKNKIMVSGYITVTKEMAQSTQALSIYDKKGNVFTLSGRSDLVFVGTTSLLGLNDYTYLRPASSNGMPTGTYFVTGIVTVRID